GPSATSSQPRRVERRSLLHQPNVAAERGRRDLGVAAAGRERERFAGAGPLLARLRAERVGDIAREGGGLERGGDIRRKPQDDIAVGALEADRGVAGEAAVEIE